MGTWGTSLYANDAASDLRDDFRDVVRAPWDGDRLLSWALSACPSATDPADTDYSDLRLALADLFWTYGIDHSETLDTARRIIADGSDLEAKRALGMTEGDLRRRALLLAALDARWRTPNQEPRTRRMLTVPEPFLLEAGDCLVYPTSRGDLRNPYVGPREEAQFYAVNPWLADGWGAAVVLNPYLKYDVFARYVVAILASDESSKVAVEDIPTLSILHTDQWRADSRRGVHSIALSRQHLQRMRIEIVGRLSVNVERVAMELTPDSYQIAHYGTDASLANVATRGGRFNRPVPVDDPIARYLV